MSLIRQKNLSISRLRRFVFGASTERTRDVLPDSPANEDASARQAPPRARDSARRKARGHGRIPADAYTGCQHVVVPHDRYRPGDLCPDCEVGGLYLLSEWPKIVRLKGQAPIWGTCFELEQLRCSVCGKVHRAPLPESAGPDKYDASVPATIATLRYGFGLPFHRLERLQKAAGVPLPASDAWELVRDAVDRGPGAIYQHLLYLAAQGELVHNDDTGMRVLELTAKLKKNEPLREDDPKRSGVFTTSILSMAKNRPEIALFITGPQHAGENLYEVLRRRLDGLPPPIQMSDALSRNLPGELQTIVANCLSHGRRNFVEVADAFPAEVRHVLMCLKQVYATDGEARRKGLSPDERLRLHQKQSRPVMNDLHRWLKAQFDERKVEPNSSLGRAIFYLLNHWEKLTLFLREPGAPLDNNICERALKLAIRHRKNSLFYKTLRGAAVGDLYMSLIQTCHLSRVDPIHYMTEILRNEDRVKAAPADWLPWNYRSQLASVSAPAE